MKLRLSASNVKSWFQYNCERKLAYDGMPHEEFVEFGVEKVSSDEPGPWAQIGDEYEERLFKRLRKELAEELLIPQGAENFLSKKLSCAFFVREREETHAYQPQLWETATLRQRFRLDDDVELTFGFPDLLYVTVEEEAPEFHIVDIKATQRANYYHKIQIAYYSLMLDALLADIGIDGAVAPRGEIWHLPAGAAPDTDEYEVHTFEIESYRQLVLDFFRQRVPQLLQLEFEGGDPTFFHIYFKCEQCPYLPHCQKSIASSKPVNERDLSAVAGFSHNSKRVMQEEVRVTTVGELAELPSDELRQRSRGQSWVLNHRGKTLIHRARALRDEKVERLPEAMTWMMPPHVDVGIFLVADRNPIDGKLVTLGCLKVHGSERELTVEIIESASPEDERRALLEVLGTVYGYLTEVDAHNQQNADKQLQAHLFIYEPSEAKDLQDALGRHLDDPSVRKALLDLIRIFPPDDLVVGEPEYHGRQHLPATAVRSVFEQLYALPVQVSHDLRRVSDALHFADSSLGEPYNPLPRFDRPFSSRLPIDICREIREGKADKSQVEGDVHARLLTTAAMVQWLEDENERADERFLRLEKQPFSFQATFDPFDAELFDVLRAQALLENRANELATLVELAQPAKQRRDRARCYANLQLTHHKSSGEGGAWMGFRVPEESLDAELTSDSWGLILHNDDPDIRLDPGAWKDFQVDLTPMRRPKMIGVQIPPWVYKSARFQKVLEETPKDGWFVDQAHLDLTTERLVEFMKFIAGHKS